MAVTTVCICGGGSLGHVCAGVLSSLSEVSVNILSRHPEAWNGHLCVKDCNGVIFDGTLNRVSSNPEDVVKGCDIVFLCLPGYALEDTLVSIKPYLEVHTVVGSVVSSTGFFFAAHRIFGAHAKLFGFQRTPFIARTAEYGRKAFLLGYKPQVSVAVENVEDTDGFLKLIQRLWLTPVKLLKNFYEASLTNSNPILHTGRLYSMWKDWDGKAVERRIKFYEEWTDDASRTIIDMDGEFQKLLEVLPVSKDAVPPLLEYYESSDAEQLTAKIKSITAFQGLEAPMMHDGDGWIPDFESRYFSEDFPFGLRFIYELTKKYKIDSPTVDEVYEWGISCLDLNKTV